MIDFQFTLPTKIFFGKDSLDNLSEQILGYGKKILFHYGGKAIKNLKLYDKIIYICKENNIEVFELSGVLPNPRVSLVRQGVDICKKNNIDLILAVGGGSVIDSAKAIGLGALYDGDVWNFYNNKQGVSKTLPVGVVLTIPAAGSETSTSSVVTNEEGLYKRSCGGEIMRPKFCILNPEYSYTLPNYQTACGAADIMAHIIERYFTKVENVDLTDRLCEATLQCVIKNAPIALSNPSDYNSRAEIMWSGSIAHNDLLGTGRIGDWATHNIEHELSAIYDIAHGAGLSIVFPAWMKYVYKTDIPRFAQFANRVFNIPYDFRNAEKTALEGIKALETFFKSIGLPIRLSDANIDDKCFEEMASKATEGGNIGNFVSLSKEDIIKIYKLAI